MTITTALQYIKEKLTTAHFEDSTLEASVLLQDVMGLSYTEIRILGARELQDQEMKQIHDAVERRVKGEPLAYIVGFGHFYGRKFKVTKDTLIPRPETEELVEMVLPQIIHDDVVVDVGTGSGVIAVTLAMEQKKAKVLGCDISLKALEVAEENAHVLCNPENRPTFFHCTHFAQLQTIFTAEYKRMVIVANLPYIPSHEVLELEDHVKGYEPHLALDGGPTGAEIMIALLDEVWTLYTSQNKEILVFFEMDPVNIPPLDMWFNEHQGLSRIIKKDMNGIERFYQISFPINTKNE